MSRSGRGSGGAQGALVAADTTSSFLLDAALAPVPDQAVHLSGLPGAGSGFSGRVPGAVLIGLGAALTPEHRRTGPAAAVSGWLELPRSI